MGDDWAGKFDEFGDVCEVVYLARTPAISTTAIIEHIADLGRPVAVAGHRRVRVAPRHDDTRGTMRRIVTTAVAIALVGGALSAPPSLPTPTARAGPGPPASSTPADLLELTPEPALPASRADRADGVRDARHRAPGAGGQRPPRDPSATLALRDLWLKRSELTGPSAARRTPAGPPDRRRRPTTQGFGYTVAEAAAALQHPPVRPLRPHRHRRPAVARLARPEPRGDGLGVDHHRRPDGLPRAADRRHAGREPALRRLPQGPRR